MTRNDVKIEEQLKMLDDLQSQCTGCGLCSEVCATFQESGWEHESPRGRIHLAAQLMHGRIHPDSPALSTFDRCLSCHACETLCPEKVSYNNIRTIVQDLRRKLGKAKGVDSSHFRKWVRTAYRIGHPFWRKFGSRWLSLPGMNQRSNGSFSAKKKRPAKGEAVLAYCCCQDLFQHEELEQTIDLMDTLGLSMKVDSLQPCCGAIFERLSNGGEESVAYPEERKKAERLQKKMTDSFLQWLPEKCYISSQMCLSYITSCGASVLDLYGMIERTLNEQRLMLAFSEPREVYYQPYCRAKERMSDAVLRLLVGIEGLIVREMSYPKACCGGYCGEALLHPEYSKRLVANKLVGLAPDSTVVVASPDCFGAIQSYVNRTKSNISVIYPIGLLLQADIKKRD